MDYSFLAIGLLFALSTAGIPLYAFIFKKHFVRQRAYYIVQGFFWFVLSGISAYAIFLSDTTVSLILNGVLIVLGFLFGVYTIINAIKDKGSYVLPYAKLENQEAFKKYVNNLDVTKIEIRTMSANKYDIIEFTDVEEHQKQQIIEDISTNTDLVLTFGTSEANKKLLKSFTFALFIIAIAFLI